MYITECLVQKIEKMFSRFLSHDKTLTKVIGFLFKIYIFKPVSLDLMCLSSPPCYDAHLTRSRFIGGEANWLDISRNLNRGAQL